MHGFWRHDDPIERANACLIAFSLFEHFGDHIGLTLGGPLF